MSKNLVQKFSASSHPTTYALLVGIDAYPVPEHRLRGCKNDVEAIVAFLEKHPGRRELQVRKLLDEEASRENVIKAWLEFGVAKDGDVCLFYFSGHGSSGESPGMFRHIDVNGRMQSIVCYDSRLAGGTDLTDKELSQLTWTTTYDRDKAVPKRVHLATIFDCCYAGGNTKEVEHYRGIDDAVIPDEIKAYFGYQNFDRQLKGGKVIYTPKRGPHIQLAASGEREKAKERNWEGKARGVYSYFLLQLLQRHKGALTYGQLQQALFITLQNQTSRQTPQLEAVATLGTNQGFLHLADHVPSNAYVLSYHREFDQWLVHTGQIQGMAPDQLDQFQFYVPATDSTHGVKEVYLSHAALADFESTLIDQVFLASLHDLGTLKLPIRIDSQLKDKLDTTNLPSLHFYFAKEDQAAKYEIKEIANQVCLFHHGRSLHRSPLPHSSQAIRALTQQLEGVAKWQRVLDIQNERSRLKPKRYQINWYKQEGADAYPNEEQAPAEWLDTKQKEAQFSYRWGTHYKRQEKTLLEPAFRLSFTNKSGQALYVSALYLQADYKITDRFCPPTLLDPGKSLDFQYRTKRGRLYRSIFLSIYPQLLQEGITIIKEYIKLFISYKPFSLEHLKQDGLYSQLVNATPPIPPSKAIGSKTDRRLGSPGDWTVETLTLSIEKPD